VDEVRERWRDAGGIRELVELIDEHQGPFEYDWRTRFHLPLSVVGESMSWGEARRLVTQLCLDPSSHVAAALLGWSYPVSHEWLVGVSVRQLTAAAHFKDPAPYPVPWESSSQSSGSRVGTAAEQVLTQEQIDQLLAQNSGRALSPPKPQ